ncbi:P-loop containing nucleoside triphosphate hydrolase [Lasallia pustulata]|uniref:ATP-dependent DNA helicase n=1 Tax=Lasallia pustulata TaxID=136370 RepID=A0A1W5CV86_9LECA|nr:P-loop containing nucleoside triphosphate hydrolase [Lasallia pustulata]
MSAEQVVWEAEQGGVDIGEGVLVAVDGVGVEELFQWCPPPGWKVEQPVEGGEDYPVVHWGQGRPGAVKYVDVSAQTVDVLWNRFCANIYDDLPQCLQSFAGVPVDFEDPYYDYGLFLINALLTDFDKTLASYQLPQYTLDWNRLQGNPLIQAELQYASDTEQALRDEKYQQFNADQQQAFNTIVAAIEQDPAGAHFFLQGPAGTGKTFLYQRTATSEHSNTMAPTLRSGQASKTVDNRSSQASKTVDDQTAPAIDTPDTANGGEGAAAEAGNSNDTDDDVEAATAHNQEVIDRQ